MVGVKVDEWRGDGEVRRANEADISRFLIERTLKREQQYLCEKGGDLWRKS